ncbi:MAG: hypothetical protein ABIJ09_26090 [Pseudomonadota bacterium]
MTTESPPPTLRAWTLGTCTILVAVLGTLTLYWLVRDLPWPGRSRLVLGLALLVPVLLVAVQFLVKLRIGIRKPWMALTYWALWQSTLTFTVLALVLRHAGAARLPLALLVLAAQLTPLLLAVPQCLQRWRTWALAGLVTVLTWATQLAVLLAMG